MTTHHLDITRETLQNLYIDSPDAYKLLDVLSHSGNPTKDETLVARYLASRDPDVRAQALIVLVHHWGLEKYGLLCTEWLFNDTSVDVRRAAAMCLGTILVEGDLSPRYIINLLRSLKHPAEDESVHATAYVSLLRAYEAPHSMRPNPFRRFDAQTDVDWDFIEGVVESLSSLGN